MLLDSTYQAQSNHHSRIRLAVSYKTDNFLKHHIYPPVWVVQINSLHGLILTMQGVGSPWNISARCPVQHAQIDLTEFIVCWGCVSKRHRSTSGGSLSSHLGIIEWEKWSAMLGCTVGVFGMALGIANAWVVKHRVLSESDWILMWRQVGVISSLVFCLWIVKPGVFGNWSEPVHQAGDGPLFWCNSCCMRVTCWLPGLGEDGSRRQLDVPYSRLSGGGWWAIS